MAQEHRQQSYPSSPPGRAMPSQQWAQAVRRGRLKAFLAGPARLLSTPVPSTRQPGRQESCRRLKPRAKACHQTQQAARGRVVSVDGAAQVPSHCTVTTGCQKLPSASPCHLQPLMNQFRLLSRQNTSPAGTSVVFSWDN